MKTILLVLLIVAGFVGCSHRKPATETISNGNYEVEFLFEQDGCKMYRFDDGVRYVYWCNCEGKVNADYETHQSNGKTSSTTYHKEETITTKPKR